MYAQQDRRERDAAVDLSFSQILEVRSSSYKRRPSANGGGVSGRSGIPRFQQQQQKPNGSAFKASASLPPPSSSGSRHHNLLDSVYEEPDEGNSVYSPIDPQYQQQRREARISSSASSFTEEDEDWATGDDGQIGQDMYRFVQPRRLSSWVQDDAVNACFKCHTLFTLIVRKHHCRACGRIFCSACSSQRVVIPGDYESTPASPSYNSLTSNASEMIGNISWYFLSYSSPNSSTSGGFSNSSQLGISSYNMEASQRGSGGISPEEQQEKFLKEVQRLQKEKVIGNFTPCANRNNGHLSVGAPSTKSYMSSHVPDGSVMQRVCDDCACSLQQRRNHYNIVKVFELCGLDLQELRTVGQVCRKWHRASIMCLSMFRQIQYYLPTHRLSEREKALLIINRNFLAGHTKWILQLVKAIDFSKESYDEDGDTSTKDAADTGNSSSTRKQKSDLAQEVLSLMQQERKHKCMLTMCSRLCKPQIGSVDALEILADESIRNIKLRAMCVDALLNSATENEWLSFLPVLLQSLSIESNAAASKLGQALFRQAHCDIRFCYDFYWGLTVTSEDASCRRKFDGMKQRLLLTLSQFKHNASYGPLDGVGKPRHDDIAEQLLRGQEFVDLMWKVPHRVPIRDVRQHFQNSVAKSLLFEGLDKVNSENGGNEAGESASSRPLLRLPVDPLVKVSGINYKTIEVKRSAEAPMIITCTGVERDDDEEESGATSSRRKAIAAATGVDPLHPVVPRSGRQRGSSSSLSFYRLMYKRDDLRKDAVVQNIINVMYLILKQETRLDIPLVTYRVLPTSSFDGLIEIVENAHTLYSIIRDHGNILNFLHHYNGHRTLSEISTSFRESLAAYTVITFLLGVGDRHADNVMLTKEGILFHIDYGFILGKDPKPLQPPMRLDHYMIEALGGSQTEQFEQFKKLCVIAFNCLRRHVSLFMILLNLVVKAVPEITDFDMNYTQSDLEAFVVERFLPGQTDDEAATALGLRMEGKLNEKIGLKLSDFVHAHANEKTVSKGMVSVGSSVKIGVEAVEATVSTVASSLTSGASSIYNYMWGSSGGSGNGSGGGGSR